MKIVHQWLAELVDVPADIAAVASAIALRGFEVASVERGVIDFEITANRPDCLNHVGIAREASVIWKSPVRPLALAPAVESGETIDIDLQDAELCPRYCAQMFEVRIGPSPAWLADRLEAAGVRPISNIVDVTNYVMLEMGQPMHAFDAARLEEGRLVIRPAAAGEPLTTLDGVDRQLDADMASRSRSCSRSRPIIWTSTGRPSKRCSCRRPTRSLPRGRAPAATSSSPT